MIKFLSTLVTIAMVMILGVTFVQVLVRFIFHVPLGGWDEVPTYMMLLGVWLTAAVNAKKKDHISLDLYVLFIKNEKARKIIQIIGGIITITVFIIFTVSLVEFTGYNFEKGATTAGMKAPYWIILAIIVFGVVLMIFYYIVHLINDIKEVLKWK
ncbi:MAG: TRAP transporter small permease [Deferribacteraceae bacterium]|jgi:TRAP-type C4-dicarboxylate transport system permease small subunit|nr:TRAP transporter small permease [Deferribacteraceae bacterium]